MQVAELFITLGIKGSDKTIQAFAQVEKGIKDTAGMAIEAKAALLGAGYALEQFFAKSGAQGTSLSNFNALIGEGTQILQRYQYAARQVGVSNEEMEGTFKNMSQIAAKQRLGIATPSMFGVVARETGGWTGRELQQAEQHPELMLQKIQQAWDRIGDVGTKMLVGKAYGLSDNIMAGMAKGIFRPENMAQQRPDVYSEKEVEALNKSNIAWSNLNAHIEKAIGHFNAAHGGQLVRDFTILTDVVMKLAEALVQLAERAHVFDYLQQAFTWLEHAVNRISFKDVQSGIKEVGGDIDRVVAVISGIKERTHFSIDMTGVQEAIRNTIALLNKLFSLLDSANGKTTAFDVLANAINALAAGINAVVAIISNLASVTLYQLETPAEQKKDVKGQEASKNQSDFLHAMFGDTFTNFFTSFAKAISGAPAAVSGYNDKGEAVIRKNASDAAVAEHQTKTIVEKTDRAIQSVPDPIKDWVSNLINKQPAATTAPTNVTPLPPNVPQGAAVATPTVTAPSQQTKQTTQNLNVNQNINLTPAEGVTAQQVADAVDRNNRNAFRQLDSQVQWS